MTAEAVRATERAVGPSSWRSDGPDLNDNARDYRSVAPLSRAASRPVVACDPT